MLVTFKSHQSVPPYRIENHCSDVYVYFVQACLAGERPGRWNWLQPRPNGSSLAYAWDEPNEEHLLRVKVLAACSFNLFSQRIMFSPQFNGKPDISGCFTAHARASAIQGGLAITMCSNSSGYR